MGTGPSERTWTSPSTSLSVAGAIVVEDAKSVVAAPGVRTQGDGLLHIRLGFIEAALCLQNARKALVSLRISWVELESPLQFLNGA